MAKLNDKETLSIARAVSDVLEGKQEAYHGKKKKEQYDSDKDHNMDPTSHVKKDEKTGMYCVYNVKGKKVAEFKTKAEADAYSKKNHDALMKEGPEEPRAKGEKEFKDKHVIKKSGENPDGTVTKEAKVVLTDEEKYKEFFARALEKFGVKSPAELDKEKRKEFFNYVDKNYKSVDEVLGVVKKAASKVKKGVQRGVDKAVGTDLSGDKKAEKLKKLQDEMKEEESKRRKAEEQLKNVEKRFRAGEIDKEKKADLEDFYGTQEHTHYQKIEDLKDKIQALKSGKKESVDEVLGAVKKAAKSVGRKIDKVAGTDLSGDKQAKIKAQIKELEKKLAATAAKHKKAQDDGDEEREDYWGGIEAGQASDLENLKDKLRGKKESVVDAANNVLNESLNEFLGHRIPSAGADSSGIRKATGADNKAPNTGSPRQSDDNKVRQIQNRIAQKEAEAEKHDKAGREFYSRAEDAKDRGDDDKYEDLMARSDEAESQYQSAKNEVEELKDDLKKAKAEFNKKNKKESVDEGLIDTIKTQLANLKKKKDSGNSSMDDATITKIASLLQKKARAAQEMEKLRDAADEEHSKARDAEDKGDDGSDHDARAFDLDRKADTLEEKIEEIDDQIQKLKKGASKSEDVKEYGNVMSKKMKMRKDKEVHASYGKK
tara:strand:- start:2888 stop:4858 length:1971 start_codon:yes stop_codon:yes gene_type:complete